MANLIDISDDEERANFKKRLGRIIQSANLNFLIGSGCSYPTIKVLGNTEKEIMKARTNGQDEAAEKLLQCFLQPFLENTKLLIEGNITDSKISIKNYKSFIKNISNILFNRKTNIISSQAIVFTTNYDLLLEYAMDDTNEYIILCDGFKRTSNINNKYYFSSTEYFNTIFNTGNLYRYKVEIPTINYVKIHGSLNWQKNNGKIVQDLSYINKADALKNAKSIDKIKEFNSMFNFVLPQDKKLEMTILDEIYYDLLRIYSNELDKENTILITEGFSFADQHILEITKRALKNRTLSLIAFCYNDDDKKSLLNIFDSYRNVDIVSNGTDNLEFRLFNNFFSEIITLNDDV